jgi:transcriptional regulator with XRE-family HTH domain
MHDNLKNQEALKLYNEGLNLSKISKKLGISRSTIRYWTSGKLKNNILKLENFNPEKYIIENKIESVYSYVLGLYLGDGYINKQGRTYKIRFFLDGKYKTLNDFVRKNLSLLFPKNSIGTLKTKKINSTDTSMEIISCHNNYITSLFPQHGPKKKHQRSIILEEWQLKIIEPSYLLTGLFHSDGSYYLNNKTKKNEYSFSNYSLEIIQIFKNCLEHYNVSNFICKTRINKNIKYQIFVTKKESVEKLNSLIGTKNFINLL